MKFSMLLLLLGSALLASASMRTLWPLPQKAATTGETFQVSATSFTFSDSGASTTFLKDAWARYKPVVFPVAAAAPRASAGRVLSCLSVAVSSASEALGLATDESYTLEVASPCARIQAKTVYGALRGLETFAQIVEYDAKTKTYTAEGASIVDTPRFAWRGLLVDTARHYYPVSFLKHILDALSWSKFNVMHWHIVDSQSFPFHSQHYPLLSDKGAYGPKAIYTEDNVAELVEYGRKRGVRVVPELDCPGHSYAVGHGYPNLLPKCTMEDVNDVPLNPTVNETYAYLEALFGEYAAHFGDAYIHIGGDEVNPECWAQDSAIKQWCKDHGIADWDELVAYFENRVLPMITAVNRRPVVWEEVWSNGKAHLPAGTIVEAWRTMDIVADIVAAGNPCVVASPWYLDRQVPNPWLPQPWELMDSWQTMWQVDPAQNVSKGAELILGGEACMWSEQVDRSSFDGRVWPRACAVAERLWSPALPADADADTNASDALADALDDAIARLDAHSCRLARRGVMSGPLLAGSYCPLADEL